MIPQTGTIHHMHWYHLPMSKSNDTLLLNKLKYLAQEMTGCSKVNGSQYILISRISDLIKVIINQTTLFWSSN